MPALADASLSLSPHESRVHAVAIPVPGCVPIPDLQNDMRSLGIGGVAAEDILDVIDGYEGEGYAISDKHLESKFSRFMSFENVFVCLS